MPTLFQLQKQALAIASTAQDKHVKSLALLMVDFCKTAGDREAAAEKSIGKVSRVKSLARA